MKPQRGWVPVSPTGSVWWRQASKNKSESAEYLAHCYGTRWTMLRRAGWRIVRCRVEEEK